MFDYSKEPGAILNNKYIITDESPLVSIITPFLNSGRYFEQTFNSVINQTFPYFEWIIVNDVRTNETDKMLLEKLASRDKRITVFTSGPYSISAARNYGISKAKTEIVIPLDSDDLIEPTYIEYLYWSLYSNPEASWSYTDSVTFHDKCYLWRQDFSSDKMKTENILIYSAAIRKKAIMDVGGYSELNVHFNEDWEFWLKMIAKSKFPVHVSQLGLWYRWSNTGALARFNSDQNLIDVQKKIVEGYSDKIPNGIKAKTFDEYCDISFKKPHKWNWERKLNYKKEKNRILLLLPHIERGGADKFNLDILANIDKEKYEIGVITTLKSNNEWRQLFEQHTQDVFVLSDFLDRSEWSAFIHYYITSRSVDIVMNISSYLGYALMPWLRKEFPSIGLIDCVHAEGKYWRDGGYPRKSAAVDSILEKTFVTNEYTRQIMINNYGKNPEKIETIYTGVDEKYFDKANISSDEIKQKYRIEEGRPVVLYLCRICDEKRPFLMLEIADKIRKKIPDICFLVVGDGPLLYDLKQAVAERNLNSTVYLAGKQEDIRPYYAASDIFLLCSIKEGLAITTFEAMLMEVPVVSADVGGQKELVNEETGRLVPCLQDEKMDFGSRTYKSEEVNYYINAIVDLLSDKNRLSDMGKKCREKVLNGFTLSIMIKKLEKEFDRIKSGDGLNERIKLSNMLAVIPDVIDDYLTISSAFENLEYNNALSWRDFCNHKEYLERQIINTERQLNQIKNLRSYRLVVKYHNMVNNNKIVRLFDKCLRFFGKGARRIYRAFKAVRRRQ